ncbi:MAG TPA: hypothetical protein VJX92_01070 [Methylomirabilota bacterium]|nr:hypothetical protein [Methylomirabilota bacterium]
MKIGCHLPMFGPIGTRENVLTFGFPFAPEVPFLEPLVTLSLVAGVTERVLLGTSILKAARATSRF